MSLKIQVTCHTVTWLILTAAQCSRTIKINLSLSLWRLMQIWNNLLTCGYKIPIFIFYVCKVLWKIIFSYNLHFLFLFACMLLCILCSFEGFENKSIDVSNMEEYWPYKFEVNAATVKGNKTSDKSRIFRTNQAGKPFFFSSPEPKACWCQWVSGPFSIKLSRNHSWVKGIQVYSNDGSHLCPRGDNYEIVNIHWRN